MRILLCNCPPDVAAELARTVVQEHLAACVNLMPVRSVYMWEGELQEDAEVTLVLKTSDGTVLALRDRLLALHPYDVPEVLVLPVDTAASASGYVSWVRETTGKIG